MLIFNILKTCISQNEKMGLWLNGKNIKVMTIGATT